MKTMKIKMKNTKNRKSKVSYLTVKCLKLTFSELKRKKSLLINKDDIQKFFFQKVFNLKDFIFYKYVYKKYILAVIKRNYRKSRFT